VSHTADEIAYWLELAEARALVDVCQATAGLDGDPLQARWDLDHDIATFWFGALDIGIFNRCIGLGIGPPATEAVLDAVLEIFRSSGRSEYTIQVSPFARPSVLESWLLARGLRRGRRWVKVWRDAADPPPERTDLRLEEIGPADREDWERVVLAAFDMPDVLGPAISSMLGRDGWRHYLTYDGNEAVGAGALYLTEQVAWLGYGATLETHRGRGSQSALFARRIHAARELGAELVVTETGEDLPENPNPSYRNMLRAGFRPAYNRRNWLPSEEPAPSVQ
jgi:GNAT superfamily N-acetyltransferase